MTGYRGPYCSEQILVPGDPHVEDCVAASGINIVRAAGMKIPVSAAEREALRVDSGDTTGGMNLDALQAGIKKRYGLAARRFDSQLVIETALDEGWALVDFGRYDSLPIAWRWQKAADFLHAMSFQRNDRKTRWRADPLAFPDNNGAAMPNATFRLFAATGGWHALGLLEGSAANTNPPSQGDDMLKITNPAPALIDLLAGVEMLDPSGKPLGPVSGVVKDQVSPYEVEVGGNHYRVARASPGGISQVVLIHNPDANIRPVPVTVDVKHTVTVAVDGVEKAKVTV